MIKFDWTISLGTILTIATLVITPIVAWYAFKTWVTVKIAKFELTFGAHAEALAAHTARMNQFEERYLQLTKDVQILIGKLSMITTPDPSDRRQHRRN